MNERSYQDEILNLPYQQPFDWEHLLDFHRAHRIVPLEKIDEDFYERPFRIGKTTGYFRVTNDRAGSCLRLQVTAGNSSIHRAVEKRVRKMFDLDADPTAITKAFGQAPLLKKLCKDYPGLRVARGWDAFEVAICTILGQLVSLKQARALSQSLVEHYGNKARIIAR